MTSITNVLSPSDASRTLIVHDSQPREDSLEGSSSSPRVLRLRGGPATKPRVVWADDVIDNENMGKKSSKICCIYHKNRKFGESSSEESSDEGDSDGPNVDHSRHRHHHRHHDTPSNENGTRMRESRSVEVQELSSDEEPNAYERAPNRKKGKGKMKDSY